jgi:MerR family mercuric resistance operon transcriptional regulator
MQNKTLTIGKFAASAGVGVETVRYYQRKGLLSTPPKQTGTRRYGEQDIRQLRFIRKAQEAGFTLSEIKELITLDSTRHHERAQTLARQRIAELDIKIAEMQRARNSLEKLASDCAQGGHQQPCAILEAFDI